MKKLITICAVIVIAMTGVTSAAYYVSDGFETPWDGNYAPSWDNSGYRHGDAPVAIMQQVDLSSAGTGRSGYGLKLIAESAPTYSWGDPWWAIIERTDMQESSMLKQYDPWMSVDYYDAGHTSGMDATGQLYALPSWVNLYIDGSEDWTDVQFGGRTVAEEEYYYVCAGESGPGWQETNIARGTGVWVNFKMQLSSSDGSIHFYIDGTEVGTSYRNDYADLIGLSLNVNYDTPLSAWGENKPYVIFDNIEFGSSIPEPATIAILGLGALSLIRRKK